MRWKELFHSDSMATSEEKSQEMIALSNQVMPKLREISSYSFMETLLKFSTMSNFKRLLCRSLSSMSDSITS